MSRECPTKKGSGQGGPKKGTFQPRPSLKPSGSRSGGKGRGRGKKVFLSTGETFMLYSPQEFESEEYDEQSTYIFADKFIGITAPAGQAVVDTAAEAGCMGSSNLAPLSDILASHGLQYAWVARANAGDQPINCMGVGGRASWIGTLEIPIGIGGLNGILQMTVIEDSPNATVPFLLPISLQHHLGCNLDLKRNECVIQTFPLKTGQPRTVPMHQLPSLYRTLSIVDYDIGGWTPPKNVSQMEFERLKTRFTATAEPTENAEDKGDSEKTIFISFNRVVPSYPNDIASRSFVIDQSSFEPSLSLGPLAGPSPPSSLPEITKFPMLDPCLAKNRNHHEMHTGLLQFSFSLTYICP